MDNATYPNTKILLLDLYSPQCIEEKTFHRHGLDTSMNDLELN